MKILVDEPTNDFDIFTMNVLEQFLENYQGCLLVVSHDRYFMDKVCDSLFILEDDGNISGFVGKCSEYIQYREEKLRDTELSARTEKAKKQEENGKISVLENSSEKRKRTFKEQKEFEAIEQEVLILEDKKSALEKKMSSGEKVDFEALNREYAEVNGELEKKYVRWEELASLG